MAGSEAGGYVGRALPRREDVRILRGRSLYIDDIEMPDAAHVVFVRSPHAFARISAVRPPPSAPGLVAVITAADLPDGLRPLPVQAPEGCEVASEPHPLLAVDEVRYVGQPVAAVVAASRALAEDAAELVEVDYEELDPVMDPHASDMTLFRFERSGGDVDGAFAAAHRVVRARHVIPRVVAAPMEPRGAIASYDEGADLLTLWASAQDPHRPRAHLARVLDRHEDGIRVIVPDVGGAFGSKGALAPEAAVVAAAAIALGRPLRWTEDRMENFLAAYQGRGIEAEVELALGRDGEFLGLRSRILADIGGFLHPSSAVPPHTMAMLTPGCYRIPAVAVEATGVQTNKVPTGPYRGAGRPEAAYVLERTVDIAARSLGIDPIELRRRNLVREFPYRTPLGFTYDSGDFEACLDRALALVEPEHRVEDDRLVSTGVALYVERAGGQWEAAHASVEPGGQVVVSSSSSPHGQGHETTFAQLAADRLGLAPSDVELRFGDSSLVPRGVGTFGGRSTPMAGSAVVRALDALLDRARPIAARLLGVDEVVFARGRFAAGGREGSLGEVVSKAGGREVSLAEVAAAAGEPLEATARFESEVVFGSGAYGAVVEITRATGAVRVLRMAAVDDAGRIMNPLLAEGQVVGGTVQGLGAVLVEQALWDESGQPSTASFADYSLLTAAEVPPIRSAFVETPSPLNPLGAKGVGEGGTIGAAAAVGNAVAAALGGDGMDPPYTAERVWAALRAGSGADRSETEFGLAGVGSAPSGALGVWADERSGLAGVESAPSGSGDVRAGEGPGSVGSGGVRAGKGPRLAETGLAGVGPAPSGALGARSGEGLPPPVRPLPFALVAVGVGGMIAGWLVWRRLGRRR